MFHIHTHHDLCKAVNNTVFLLHYIGEDTYVGEYGEQIILLDREGVLSLMRKGGLDERVGGGDVD